MNPIQNFDDFVARQKQKNNSQAPIDWELRKMSWLNSIANIYATIRKEWLSKYKGQLVFKDSFLTIEEEMLGKYEAPVLEIYIGSSWIKLKPVGSMLIGAYGRIDMLGPNGAYLIIEEEWDKWKMVLRHNRMKEKEFNKENFLQAIIKLNS